jgi:hypothetical protein
MLRKNMLDTPNPLPTSVSAFLSYAHEGQDHDEKVLRLADQLRKDGVDARVDRYIPHPPEGWAKWMERQYRESQFILVAASEKYLSAFTQENENPSGSRYEGVLLSAELLQNAVQYDRIAVIVLKPEDDQRLPPILFSCHRYYLFRPDGY